MIWLPLHTLSTECQSWLYWRWYFFLWERHNMLAVGLNSLFLFLILLFCLMFFLFEFLPLPWSLTISSFTLLVRISLSLPWLVSSSSFVESGGGKGGRKRFRCHNFSATYLRSIPAIWNDPCASSFVKTDCLCLYVCACFFSNVFMNIFYFVRILQLFQEWPSFMHLTICLSCCFSYWEKWGAKYAS